MATLSLPPKVTGEVNGHLSMKIDEVLWARKHPGEVTAVFMWWGEEFPSTLTPVDVTQPSVQKTRNSILYEIRTSKKLFGYYLKKCGNLKIAVTDKHGMPIGCAVVPNLSQIVSDNPYEGYYPIINNFGNRVGDIHISFTLRVSKEETEEYAQKQQDSIKLSTTKTIAVSYTPASKEQDAKQISEADKSVSAKQQTKSQEDDTRPITCEPVPSVQEKSDFPERNQTLSPTGNVISQILERGKRLRNAMAMSAMEDEIATSTSLGVAVCHQKNPYKAGFCDNICRSFADRKFTPKKEQPVENEIKVLDYLSGKPMTAHEEKEALLTLRCTTPPLKILEEINQAEFTGACEKENFEKKVENPCKENCRWDLVKTSEKKHPNYSKDIASALELLSNINCIRITVNSITLNAAGARRVAAANPRQLSLKNTVGKSALNITPSGVTYFIEYQLPQPERSRLWNSDVIRNCSKRQSGFEIIFGDKSLHNINASQTSVTNKKNLRHMIESLTFKVSARHFNQRVPVSIGIAAPDSAMPLLSSTKLCHRYNLQIISSDHLPVGVMKVVLELGRDRTHFGELIDPGSKARRKTKANEDISQESVNARNSFLKRNVDNCSSSQSSAKVFPKNSKKKLITAKPSKPTNVSTTATRPESDSEISKTVMWKSKNAEIRAAKAQHVVDQLVIVADGKEISSVSSESSFSNSGRRNQQTIPANIIQPPEVIMNKQNQEMPLSFNSLSNGYLKHEVALTLQCVKNCEYWTGSSSECFLSYKFPFWDSTKNSSVIWQTYSTKPFPCVENCTLREPSRVHSVVLPSNVSLFDFLQQSFKQNKVLGTDQAISLSLFVKCKPGVDTLAAEAHLPLTTVKTLEDAYTTAALREPNFKVTSCASIEMDLWIHCSEKTKKSGQLHLKIDYRQLAVNEKSLASDLNRNQRYLSGEMTSVPKTNDRIFSHKSTHSYDDDDNMAYATMKTSDHSTMKQRSRPRSSAVSFFNKNSKWIDGYNIPKELQKSSGLTRESKKNTLGDDDFRDKYSQNEKPLHSSWEPMKDHYYSVSSPISRSLSNLNFSDPLPSGLHGKHQAFSAESYDNLHSPSSCQLSEKPTYKMKDRVRHDHGSRSQQHSRDYVGYKNIGTGTDQLQRVDKAQQFSQSEFPRSCQSSPKGNRNNVEAEDSIELIDISSQPGSSQESEILNKSHSCEELIEVDSLPDVHVIEGDKTQNSVTAIYSSISKGDCLSVVSEEPPTVFRAKIGIETALHLASTQTCGAEDGSILSFVSFHTSGMSEGEALSSLGGGAYATSPVASHQEPQWNWSSQVALPVELLTLAARRLIFKVWHRQVTAPIEANNFVGFAAVDLTALTAGLPILSGWYNVMNFTGQCCGQLKLTIEPLEDVSKYADTPKAQLDQLKTDNVTKLLENPVQSLYVAHCAFSDFPSHITQYTDILVQKVNSQDHDKALTGVVSSYQAILQHFQKLDEHLAAGAGPECNEPKTNTACYLPSRQEINDNNNLEHTRSSESCKSVQSLSKSDASEFQLDSVPCSDHNLYVSNSLPEATDIGKENTGSYEDPNLLLRQKISELDKLTKNMKEKLLVGVGNSRLKNPLNRAEISSKSSNCRDENKGHSEVHMKSLLQEKFFLKENNSINNSRKRHSDLNPIYSNELLRSSFSKNIEEVGTDESIVVQSSSSSANDHIHRSCNISDEENSAKAQKVFDVYQSDSGRRGDRTYRKENQRFPVHATGGQREKITVGDTDSGVDSDKSLLKRSMRRMSGKKQKANSPTSTGCHEDTSDISSSTGSTLTPQPISPSLTPSEPSTPAGSPQRGRLGPEGAHKGSLQTTKQVYKK